MSHIYFLLIVFNCWIFFQSCNSGIPQENNSSNKEIELPQPTISNENPLDPLPDPPTLVITEDEPSLFEPPVFIPDPAPPAILAEGQGIFINRPDDCSEDTDDDGWSDCDDNCRFDPSSNQIDQDQDGLGQICDCNDEDPNIGRVLGKVRYVSPSGSNTNNTCLNRINPCQTIAYAIDRAKASDGIFLLEGSYFENNLIIDKNLVVFGEDRELVEVDGNQEGNSIFIINPEIDATLCRMTIQNASADVGAGVNNQGNTIINNVIITNNSASIAGGGVASAEGSSIVIGDSFVNCNSASFGAGFVNAGDASIKNTVFEGNDGIGGGALANSSELTIENSQLISNTAEDSGGGIANGGNCTIIDSFIEENIAGSSGGGIATGGQMTITNSSVNKNTAGTFGGGITSADQLTISFSHLDDNTAAGAGGGGLNTDGSFTLIESTVSRNFAMSEGGGIRQADVTHISPNSTISKSTINDNHSETSGGGVYVSDGAVMTITETTINSNNCKLDGGGLGVADASSSVAIIDSSMMFNHADGSGGGVMRFSPAILTGLRSTFRNNTALNCGTTSGDVFDVANFCIFGDASCTYTTGSNNSIVP